MRLASLMRDASNTLNLRMFSIDISKEASVKIWRMELAEVFVGPHLSPVDLLQLRVPQYTPTEKKLEYGQNK